MAPFRQDQITSLHIQDTYLINLDVHADSRGLLYEVIHASDHFVNQIRQVYHVCSPRPDTIRAFHAHEELHDWFHIAHGSAIFCLVDEREDGPTFKKTVRLVMTDRKPQLLVVPPVVYHGWMSLEPNTIMTSIASEEYSESKPDEHRVPPDHFDDLFNGNPWHVDAR